MGKFTIGPSDRSTAIAPPAAQVVAAAPLIKEVFIEVSVEKLVEVRVEVPVERIVEVVVEVPVERVVEKLVEVRVEVPGERVVEKVVEVVEVPTTVEKIVDHFIDKVSYKVPSWAWAVMGLEASAIALLILK